MAPRGPRRMSAAAALLCSALLGGRGLSQNNRAAAADVSNMTACTYSYNDGNVVATYDLSGLTNDYGAYAINDQFQSTDLAYSYYFNVCENVVANTSIPTDRDCRVAEAAAYQVGGTDGFCLPTGLVEGGSFQLLSQYLGMGVDPTMGVVLTYSGGETCGITGKARKTHIIIECSNSENIPDDEEMEETDRVCEYVLKLPSKLGCPLECPLGGTNRQICSGRGVCGHDVPASKVQCLCFQDAYDEDCGSDSAWSDDNTATINAVLAILVVFVVLVVVGSVLMWRRVKSLRLDPKQYGHTSASTDGVEMSDQGLSGPSGYSDGDDDDDSGPGGRVQAVVLNEHEGIPAATVQDSGLGAELDLDGDDDSSDGESIDLGLRDDDDDDDDVDDYI